MDTALRKLALRHARRMRDRLRTLGCEWSGSAGVQGGSDPHFPFDADALAWLAAEYESGRQAHERAWATYAEIARDLSLDLAKRLAGLLDDVSSVEIRIGMENRVVHYVEMSHAFHRFPATTVAMLELERLSLNFARGFEIEPGQATAVIMTNALPKARRRSDDDIRVDRVLKSVLREMIESGQRIPEPGRPGRNTGVIAFWTDAQTRFNAALDSDPELKRRKEAGSWTSTRSKFDAICLREPEFKLEVGG